jgi:hypothetical protein
VAGALVAAPRQAGDAARELAGKIAAAVDAREPLGLAVRNLSSLGADELASVRRALEAGLRARGLVVSQSQDVQVSVSENLEWFLLVAELRSGDGRQVLLAEWPRSGDPPRSRAQPAMTLDHKLVWRQHAPILDVAFIDGVGALVLGPGFVALGEHRAWVPAPSPWPRDLRGRLLAAGNKWQAFLPGQTCSGAVLPELTISCRAGQEPWPLRIPAALAPNRNYFEPMPPPAGPGREIPPFFTAAETAENGKPLRAFAALDGRTHLFDSSWAPAGSVEQWGDDIAGIETACGSGRQIVAGEAGGAAASQSVQAFELVNREPVAVTAPVRLPGRITALWPAGAAAVLAVTRDPDTGEYAAFSIALACGS